MPEAKSPPRQRSSPQSPRPQDDGTPNPLHTPLQPTLTVPPVEKSYEWHIKSTPQASLRYFKRAIVLAERRNSTNPSQVQEYATPIFCHFLTSFSSCNSPWASYAPTACYIKVCCPRCNNFVRPWAAPPSTNSSSSYTRPR